MNKTAFIEELKNKTGLTEEQAAAVNEIFESNFFLKKKNTDKIISQISEKLSFDNDKAKEIYDAAYDLIKNEIAGKIKHPFGPQ
ncbi:MAG: hypothetical protein IJ567_02050 [Lachnospiraceae bacterium]|nr:hypothetical protein [Lachnospiraceae bacterium]